MLDSAAARDAAPPMWNVRIVQLWRFTDGLAAGNADSFTFVDDVEYARSRP